MKGQPVQGLFVPQQYPGYPGVRPPRGWVPSIDAPGNTILRLLGVYDSDTGYWVGLPLQALTEALVQAESVHSLGKLDSRDKITLTVPSGTATGAYATRKELGPVPSDEVWFITVLEMVTPAQAGGIVLGNFRVSAWEDPDDDADGQAFWENNQGQAAGGTYYAECHGGAPVLALPPNQVGVPLRLGPGQSIKLCASVTTNALTADRILTLTPYGWKGKLLRKVATS